jgi:Mn-dependent DtxR family transcriptional regulator
MNAFREKMDSNQEKAEASMEKLEEKMEETIEHQMKHILSYVDQSTQNLRRELTETIEKMHLELSYRQ